MSKKRELFVRTQKHGEDSYSRAFLVIILLCCAIFSLSGCTSLAFSGASAVYDGYHWKERIKNEKINLEIINKIKSEPKFTKENSDITVTCFDYKVLLTGQTVSPDLRLLAAKLTADTEDVQHVYDFVEIGPPDSASQTMQDAWLTSKIKGKIISGANIDTSQIKVISENGTVYLVGILTHEQANEAIDITKETEGVKKVVKIFKYINYSSS